MPVSKRLLTFFMLAMKRRTSAERVASFGFPQKSVLGRAGLPKRRMPKRRMEDSDEDVPIVGPNSRAEKLKVKKARFEDSDDDMPLFGPNGLAEKIRRQEEEQKSQQPLAPEDYLKEEVAGLSQEELNAEAVDQADFRLGIAESMASTPSKIEFEVCRSFQDEDDVARMAAAKMTRFAGRDTLKITK